jgi:hypothetical protein
VVLIKGEMANRISNKSSHMRQPYLPAKSAKRRVRQENIVYNADINYITYITNTAYEELKRQFGLYRRNRCGHGYSPAEAAGVGMVISRAEDSTSM